MNFDWKKLSRAVFIDCLSGVLMAVSVQVFAVNANFAPGGINGMAVILNYLTKIPIGTAIILLNIPIVLLSWRLIGKAFLLKSLRSMVIGALIMDYAGIYFPAYCGNAILAAVFAGIFAGAGCGLLYREESCTGGSDFLIMSAKKLRPHVSMGQLTQFIDGSVLIAAGIVYQNIDAVLYGLLYTIVTSIVVDKLMYASESGKMAMIVTRKGGELCREIDLRTGRGTTRIHASGGYSGESKEVVMCVCSRNQITAVRQAVQNTDGEAFMVVGKFDEVFGNGFHILKD